MVTTSILALDIKNVKSVYLQENESNRHSEALKMIEEIYDDIIESLPLKLQDTWRKIWTITSGTQEYRNGVSCLTSR